MSDKKVTEAPNETLPFEQHARVVLQRVRNALSESLIAVGADPTRSQAVARRLGLNKNLTWKISKIIREDDPGTAIPLLPGKAGLRIFFKSLEKAGAPAETIQSVRDAIEDFENMTDIHAGDRETLEMMLGNLAKNSEGQQQNEALRKLAFRGNSATWGVQARVQLCVNVIAPGDDPDWVDLAWLSGLIDFRRLRRDAVWAIAATRKVEDDGTLMPIGHIEAIDPKFRGDDTPPLFGEFCSKPLPDMNIDVGADGLLRYELLEGPVGNTAAATCIIGLIGRRFVRRTRARNDTLGEHNARLYTPVEMLLHDLYVHRELEYALAPSVALYSQLPNLPAYPACGRDRGLLPLWEKIQSLGGCPPDTLTPELPQYSRMIQRVFERAGWNAQDFYGFRFKMRYPPIPTLAVLRYELPDPQGNRRS